MLTRTPTIPAVRGVEALLEGDEAGARLDTPSPPARCGRRKANVHVSAAPSRLPVVPDFFRS
jgi:hypothetical protein